MQCIFLLKAVRCLGWLGMHGYGVLSSEERESEHPKPLLLQILFKCIAAFGTLLSSGGSQAIVSLLRHHLAEDRAGKSQLYFYFHKLNDVSWQTTQSFERP